MRVFKTGFDGLISCAAFLQKFKRWIYSEFNLKKKYLYFVNPEDEPLCFSLVSISHKSPVSTPSTSAESLVSATDVLSLSNSDTSKFPTMSDISTNNIDNSEPPMASFEFNNYTPNKCC